VAKKKRRRIKFLNIFAILLFFAVIAAGVFAGYFIQNRELSHFSVSYDTVDTKKEYSLRLAMVGDALIHDSVYNAYKKSGNKYDFTGMFKYIKPIIQEYDLAYYNQETILGGKSLGLSNYPQFNSPQEVGDGFLDAGFNLVSMATNHTLDKYYMTNGKTVVNSRKYWNSKMDENENLIAAGSYTSKEEQEQVIIREKNGIKYALLSYTTMTNGIPVPSGKSYTVNVYDKDKVKKDIEKYRDKVDLLMVAMHWGIEYVHYPVQEQKDIAKYLASLDVDIVIGCHSHTVQPITFIDDTLVIYSLGNFVSSQTNTDQLIGGFVDVDIKKTVYHGKTTIELSNVGADLLYTNKNWSYGRFVVYPFSKMSNSILSNYKNVYKQYTKYLTAYSKDVQIRGL
jgi:poly-gamma-glutamate synthesis protein (capsule biosynthesis protein)